MPPVTPVAEPARVASPASFNEAPGVRAMSDAAADQERMRAGASDSASDAARPFSSMPSAGSARRQALVDLLCFDSSLPARLRRAPTYSKILEAAPDRRAWVRTDEARPGGDREDRDRTDVLRVLSFAEPCDLPRARSMIDEAFGDAFQLDLPLCVITGTLKPTHDDVEVLRAIVEAGGPLGPTNKNLQGALKLVQETLDSGYLASGETVTSLLRQVEQSAASLWSYLSGQIQRILIEGRRFKRRTILGETRLRAELTTLGGETIPTYIPDGVAGKLPMLQAFPVLLVAELRQREDGIETHAEALVALALARVVRQLGPAGQVGGAPGRG